MSFILGSLHILRPTMGTLSESVDYQSLYGDSDYIKQMYNDISLSNWEILH